MRRELIPEVPVAGRRLGRHIHHDDRSRLYLADRAPIVDVLHESVGLPLNQGDVGSCTGNALVGARNSAPDYEPGDRPLTEADALAIYETETRMEGQPYPPSDPGGSGLMVCKAGIMMGLITDYRHAFGIQHALEALVLHPVMIGSGWYSSFDETDADGLIEIAPGAELRGGHEYVLNQIVAKDQLVFGWNSWGGNYGLGGRFGMTFALLARLLGEGGDATVPLK